MPAAAQRSCEGLRRGQSWARAQIKSKQLKSSSSTVVSASDGPNHAGQTPKFNNKDNPVPQSEFS